LKILITFQQFSIFKCGLSGASPINKTLGKPDQVVSEIIETHSDEFPLVFSAFKSRAGIYGFGDLQVKQIYDRQMRNK